MSQLPRRAVTVLVDNESAHPACGCEWGLSLAIDLGPGPDGSADASAGGLWLWDTGKTDLLLNNASALGLDLAQVRGLALSHGHYDHTGGLSGLLAAGFAAPVHAHPSCANPRWAEEPDGKPRRPIGPPSPLPAFEAAGPVTELAPGLTLVTDIPRAPGRFQAVAGFSLDPLGAEPDHVPDDAFLVLQSACGPVVILGCCHSGLANSLACAGQRLGLSSIHSVLGGLHLFNADHKAVDETAQALRAHGVRRLVAGHCTGAASLNTLRALLPEVEVLPLGAGQRWEF